MEDYLEDYTEALPEEIQNVVEDLRAQRLSRLADIGRAAAEKRDEAVSSRKSCGIEKIWAEDEEYYQGVDDANRDTETYVKPPTSVGGLTRSVGGSSTRCSAFFNITRQFVDSGSARMGDILLPAGDWNWAIRNSPVEEETTEEMEDVVGLPPVPKEKEDKSRIDKAEARIKDWLVECSYHSENRKVIEDCARVGTGVLMGPVPENRTTRKVSETNGVILVEEIEETVPVSKHVSFWDTYPDLNGGENIQEGSYFVYRDQMTARRLRDLPTGPNGYLKDQIDKVLEEGPNKKNMTDGYKDEGSSTEADDLFDVWYIYCELSSADIETMHVKCGPEKFYNVVVVLVNDSPVKCYMNPSSSGEFPFDFMVWQRRSGSPFGIGISRQGHTPQDMLNASMRRMMDNGGLSGSPMLAIKRGGLIPADGKWEIVGGKIWFIPESSNVNANEAIQAIVIPSMQAELGAMVQLAYKMMEDSTGIFFIMQGQQGSAPDTVGGMELLHRNASAILRRIARTYDERVTEPHIRRYYSYLLEHGEDDEKADLQIEAIGSSALVEREIQAMQMQQLAAMSMNPAFGLDPELVGEETLKALRFVPEKFKMDEEKKAKIMQGAPPPAVQAAQIRTQGQVEVAKIRAVTDLKEAKLDTDRDTAYTESMHRRDESAAQARKAEILLKRETAMMNRDLQMLKYANDRNITLDRVKADLAKVTMTLNTQKELAAGGPAPEVAEPIVEPLGRAPDGEAFQK